MMLNDFEGHLGTIWSHLEAILGHLGAILGHRGAILGHLGAMLEPSSPILKLLGANTRCKSENINFPKGF